MSERVPEAECGFVFVGSTNALPMLYALRLRERGFPVRYVVTDPPSAAINRPETHYPSVTLPYPEWISEIVPRYSIEVAARPRHWSRQVRALIAEWPPSMPLLFVLNDTWVACAGHLPSGRSVWLTHGDDLWALCPGMPLAASGRHLGVSTPARRLAYRGLMTLVRHHMKRAVPHLSAVIAFPGEFEPRTAQARSLLEARGVRIVTRADADSRVVPDRPAPALDGRPMRVLVPVRNEFADAVDPKGTDWILQGLALFRQGGGDFRATFFLKGGGTQRAQQLARDLGLDDVIEWREQLPLADLLDLYFESDVVFDQVAGGWLGAIGLYAIYIGVPLISNVQAHVDAGILPADSGIGQANSPEQVAARLREYDDPQVRREAGQQIRALGGIFDPERIVDALVELGQSS